MSDAKVPVPFATANRAQLYAFATVGMGLEVAHNIGEANLRAKILEAGFTGEEIEVADELLVTTAKQLTPADVAKRKTVRIMIPLQEGVPGGMDAVPVGVNGKVARIMRGKEVDVPVEYVEALKNAVKVIYDRDEHSRPINPREVPIYPFSILAAVA